MTITSVGMRESRFTGVPVRKLSFGESVATEIRVELARRDVTQQDLAEALGVTPIWVSRRLRGHVPLAVDELAAIAQLLGLKTRDLLPESEDGDNVKAFRQRVEKELPRLDSNQEPTEPQLDELAPVLPLFPLHQTRKAS